MADSSDGRKTSNHSERRRKTLLLALAGAGVPLSERVVSGQWIAPVVDAVALPAHAATSQANATGMFASSILSENAGSSPFANIAERSEEEILDLFVSAAEPAAVDGCTVSNYCSGSYSAELVDLVATVDENPTNTACVQARVNFTSCGSNCLTFDFQNVAVDGENVSISQNCSLSLTGMRLTEAGLSGHWSYSTLTYDGVKVVGSGPFSALPGGRGCGGLSLCPP